PVLSDEAMQALRTRIRNRFGEGAEPPAYPGDGGHKVSAAWLIEHAGFERGYRRSGAAISENHTLALVNRGGTTQDLLALGAEIAQTVRDVFGVELRREPVVVS
ncbi:UDP-N-acetylenolpyruvoylglucosamine reductase, partial [mine drainage metagenome]